MVHRGDENASPVRAGVAPLMRKAYTALALWQRMAGQPPPQPRGRPRAGGRAWARGRWLSSTRQLSRGVDRRSQSTRPGQLAESEATGACVPGSSHANYGAGSSLRKLEGRLIERPSSPHGTELHANDRGGQWLGNQQRHRLLRLRVHGALSAVRVHGARDGGRRSLEGRRRVLGAVLSRGSCSWKQDSSTKRGRL